MKRITNKDRKLARAKLTLHRDTLAHLTGDQLKEVAGGVMAVNGSDNSACSSCSSTFI
jgi:hypothetical protein